MARLSCPHCNASFGKFAVIWRSRTRCPLCQQPVELAFHGLRFLGWLACLVALSFVAGRFIGTSSNWLPGIGGAPILALVASSYWRKSG